MEGVALHYFLPSPLSLTPPPLPSLCPRMRARPLLASRPARRRRWAGGSASVKPTCRCKLQLCPSHLHQTPAKAKKTPTKKSPARRKAFSESEDSSDDDDQAAVEYEQEQLPKELQSDHPGIKSPMRGLPKTRLRSKARVSYVSY